MWFAYSQANWPRALDLRSAISRLRTEFRDMAFDADHESIYNVRYCFEEEEVLWLRDLAEKYTEAATVCILYLDDEISIECLLYELQKLELQSFITEIKDFLPQNLKDRFVSRQEEADEERQDAC